MRARMIVTDLDGTLLRTDKTISDYTAAVLSECRDTGIKIAFATARPLRAIMALGNGFVPDYVIADNGATIAVDGAIVKQHLIPGSSRDKLIAACLRMKEVTCITVEAGDCLFTNHNGPSWGPGWNPVHTDFRAAISGDTPKISVECDLVDALQELLRQHPELHMYGNSGERWHQIMPRTATKTQAIMWIGESLGINLTDVAAFGDDCNDVEMLCCCGIGVAVANAIDAAKAAADFICDTNNNDGVARWITQNILAGY